MEETAGPYREVLFFPVQGSRVGANAAERCPSISEAVGCSPGARVPAQKVAQAQNRKLRPVLRQPFGKLREEPASKNLSMRNASFMRPTAVSWGVRKCRAAQELETQVGAVEARQGPLKSRDPTTEAGAEGHHLPQRVNGLIRTSLWPDGPATPSLRGLTVHPTHTAGAADGRSRDTGHCPARWSGQAAAVGPLGATPGLRLSLLPRWKGGTRHLGSSLCGPPALCPPRPAVPTAERSWARRTTQPQPGLGTLPLEVAPAHHGAPH